MSSAAVLICTLRVKKRAFKDCLVLGWEGAVCKRDKDDCYHMSPVKRKSASEHAQYAHSNHHAHAQSIIRAFALHSYNL